MGSGGRSPERGGGVEGRDRFSQVKGIFRGTVDLCEDGFSVPLGIIDLKFRQGLKLAAHLAS